MLPVMSAVKAFGMSGEAEGSEGKDSEGRNERGRFEGTTAAEAVELLLFEGSDLLCISAFSFDLPLVDEAGVDFGFVDVRAGGGVGSAFPLPLSLSLLLMLFVTVLFLTGFIGGGVEAAVTGRDRNRAEMGGRSGRKPGVEGTRVSWPEYRR